MPTTITISIDGSPNEDEILNRLDAMKERIDTMDATTQAKLDAIAAQDAQELAGIQALVSSSATVVKTLTDQLDAQKALTTEVQAQLDAAKSNDAQDAATIADDAQKIADLQAKLDAATTASETATSDFNAALDKIASDNQLNLNALTTANNPPVETPPTDNPPADNPPADTTPPTTPDGGTTTPTE